MATISNGSVTVTIQPGEQYRVIASGEAYVDIGGGSTESYRLINGSSERLLGGFIVATRVTIRVVSGNVEYRIEPNIAGYAGADNNGGIYDADGSQIYTQKLPHLVGLPVGNIGVLGNRTIQKCFTFSSASITSGVLNLAVNGTAGSGQTPNLGAGGFALNPAGDGMGSMIFDTGGLLPFGTYIASYGSGGNRNALAGNYNLANFYGSTIPDIPSGSTIFAAAGVNYVTNYKLTTDCNYHQAHFGNWSAAIGASTTGTNADTPVTNDLRLYAFYEFVGNDGVNANVVIQATFDGKPYLDMPGGIIVCKKNDPVAYPAYAGENVAIKVFVINGDLKGSAFTIPAWNTTQGTSITGLAEFCLHAPCSFGKKLLSDTSGWALKQTLAQYRPISFIAQQVKNADLPEVTILGDSIASGNSTSTPNNNWPQILLSGANIAYTNLAKSGEAQFNWPMNAPGRMKALAGNILLCELATNGAGIGAEVAANWIKSIVKQARAAGFKRVVCCTSPVQTSASVQISASSISGTTLTVASFTTGSDLPIGAVLWDGTNFVAKVASKTDSTHFELTNVDGTAYTGGSKSGITVYAWGADSTQTTSVAHVAMNGFILGWPSGGEYPDAILDVWAATRSPTDQAKWEPFISIDGVHPYVTNPLTGVFGGQLIVNYGLANGWLLKITG